MGRDTSTEAAGQLLQLDSARVISDVTRRFAEVTTDYARLLESVAHALAESVHDLCSVLLLTPDGKSMTTSSIHAIDADVLAELRRSFAQRDLSLSKQPGLQRLLETGQGVVIPRLSQQANPTDEQRHWQARIGLHSTIVVPVRVQGRSIGALTLGRFRSESPPFQQSDLVLAQTLADHAGLAIENARLYAAAEEARLSAELAQRAMRQSEAAHRLFFDSNPNASYVIDAENLQVLAVNDAALQLYGYSRAEFLQLSLPDLRYPEDQQRLSDLLQKAGSDVTSGLARHRRKDGSLIRVEGGSHLSTFEGRPARLVLLSDQTKRVQAETERDESERRLQRTLDDMREGYTIMDHELRYRYVNRAGAEQTHLTREQLLGRTPLELYPEFEGSKIHRALMTAVEKRVPVRVEEEFLRADREVAYFELNIQPIPEGLSVLSIDQTERHRAERHRDALEGQLRQAQKLEAIGRLAGGVAHDFNNVLSVILGYSEDMIQSLEPSDPRWQDMKEIESAATRAAALTKQLLMFSRQQVLEPKVLDLNDVLANMDRMLSRILGEQVELTLLPGAGLGRIRADRSNLEQVLMNLTVNARDAMPEGGRVTLETANVVVDEAFVSQHLGCKPGAYVRLTVTDTGTGMDATTQARIFEPFFSTKERGQGTGLGLSTVFGIVQQSGGGVWVYSELGHGTTFKVYLPRVDAELDTLEPERALLELTGSETILLVEDEPAVREVARRILERHGYRVLVAASPSDALLLCQADFERIHLLVTDVVMPGASGTQLAQTLASTRPSLKVLYVSGYTDGSIEAHGIVGHSAAFLQKPFTAESLARKVRSVLNGDSLTPPTAGPHHT